MSVCKRSVKFTIEYIRYNFYFYFVFFFFKQKTAYEIGTGDWSSDVCLPISMLLTSLGATTVLTEALVPYETTVTSETKINTMEIGRASCRERV